MIHPHRIVRHLLVAGVVLTLLAPLAAAADFRESIRIGDERRSEEDPEGALAAYAEAQAAATADTDIAIALSKRASVKAYDQEKYDEAADLAAQALALTESHPVGHVTAYRVKALCEMKGDEDYEAAEKTLVRALALDDVDWAKPTLHLMLGDARRLNGQGSEAPRRTRRSPPTRRLSRQFERRPSSTSASRTSTSCGSRPPPARHTKPRSS